MSQHTPQFQTLSRLVQKCAACTHDDRSVVILCPFHAAAPAMYSLLQRLVAWDQRLEGSDHRGLRVDDYIEARALLAKVEG